MASFDRSIAWPMAAALKFTPWCSPRRLRHAAQPALLSRTPYDTERPMTPIEPVGIAGAAAGYVIVMQDIRGRFRSGGAYVMAVNERDGAA